MRNSHTNRTTHNSHTQDKEQPHRTTHIQGTATQHKGQPHRTTQGEQPHRTTQGSATQNTQGTGTQDNIRNSHTGQHTRNSHTGQHIQGTATQNTRNSHTGQHTRNSHTGQHIQGTATQNTRNSHTGQHTKNSHTGQHIQGTATQNTRNSHTCSSTTHAPILKKSGRLKVSCILYFGLFEGTRHHWPQLTMTRKLGQSQNGTGISTGSSFKPTTGVRTPTFFPVWWNSDQLTNFHGQASLVILWHAWGTLDNYHAIPSFPDVQQSLFSSRHTKQIHTQT